MKTFIDVELPKGFMNVSVTTDNFLVADTNNSADWDTLKFPLPKGEWRVHSYDAIVDNQGNKATVKLVDKRDWFRRFFEI